MRVDDETSLGVEQGRHHLHGRERWHEPGFHNSAEPVLSRAVRNLGQARSLLRECSGADADGLGYGVGANRPTRAPASTVCQKSVNARHASWTRWSRMIQPSAPS